MRSAESSEECLATHLNHVVHPLILELLLPNAQHARLEGALPGHELKGLVSVQCPSTGGNQALGGENRDTALAVENRDTALGVENRDTALAVETRDTALAAENRDTTL